MKTVLLRFAVHTLASLPSSCEQARETEGQGAGSCCRRRPSLPDRRRRLGVRRQAEPVADPTPRGAPGLAFPPSAVQLRILDSASQPEEETGGRGGGDGTRKEREGREASLQGQRGEGPLREGGSPLWGAHRSGAHRGLLRPGPPGQALVRHLLAGRGRRGQGSSKPPASCPRRPRHRSLPTAPRKPQSLLSCGGLRGAPRTLRVPTCGSHRHHSGGSCHRVPSALSALAPGKNRAADIRSSLIR